MPLLELPDESPGLREMLSWLGRQWPRLVEEAGMLRPAPARYRAEGAAVRVAVWVADESWGWSLHASRDAWVMLDAETGMAWLRICHQVFTGACSPQRASWARL